ncbi:glycosyltransferase family 8 protein [Marinomonas transparens]|uniref:Glycosyltransferase family 8 protein n=1 Tax=Marinomonas transparens TaxID=2795388 RepID=A0A934K037_9GAMM|nr:glycosyltransferase family 8 protein [Marinomonas transparens]MBJ7540057.1 glycosyltransferase family 8 protein [Marinomonas transparens]
MISIVLCSDENYAPYSATVMVSSLVNTAAPEDFIFYLLTPGLTDGSKDKLQTAVESYGAQLEIISIEVSNFISLNIDLGRFGIGALLRLYMHRYLPEITKKVIYLDCDLLVLGDLAELWGKNLNGLTLGAITDLCSPSVFKGRQKNYFNSGVLLIDLIKWKNDEIGEKALTYLDKNLEKSKYPDQDALNSVLKGECLPIDLSWNFQPTSYAAYEKNYDYLENRRYELYTSIQKPNIVHFIGSVKPWSPDCVHPLQKLFIKFSEETPWPISIKKLRSNLSLSKRVRLFLKKNKIKRRRKMTKYRIY